MRAILLLLACLPLNALKTTHRFRRLQPPTSTTTTSLSSSPTPDLSTPSSPQSLLKTRGYQFALSDDRRLISFGQTVELSARLPSAAPSDLDGFIRDPDRVAKVIWDGNKMTALPPTSPTSASVTYRLQLMKLNFLALVLSPSVDLKMLTKEVNKRPQFMMESVGYEPNVAVLGNDIDPDSLSIQIKVAGIMKTNPDESNALVGLVGFETRGKLPLVLRAAPRRAVRKAGELICATIIAQLRKTYDAKVKVEFTEWQKQNN